MRPYNCALGSLGIRMAGIAHLFIDYFYYCSLAVRNGEDNGPTKKEPGPTDLLLYDGEPP